jgi:hypothetical protein
MAKKNIVLFIFVLTTFRNETLLEKVTHNNQGFMQVGK